MLLRYYLVHCLMLLALVCSPTTIST
uniref:Uncharacterized protein n=1 Tax=Rhizophora mucronata TaxID=61149 RepID=A0A2P2P883_RHIMU